VVRPAGSGLFWAIRLSISDCVSDVDFFMGVLLCFVSVML
jgi:hypothetical protein